MNSHDIIEMAKNEYGIYSFTADSLAQFVSLIAKAEREACAKVCEDIAEQVTYQRNSQEAADRCADAIRARGKP